MLTSAGKTHLKITERSKRMGERYTLLRTFSDFFIIMLPILYGPYFAHEAAGYALDLTYVMPVLFAVILVGLDNI